MLDPMVNEAIQLVENGIGSIEDVDAAMRVGLNHPMGPLELMDAAGLIAGEKVQIVDNNNGERFETYIIRGERGSGCICLNGAAARKVQVGDTIIIMSYALMDFEEAKTFSPKVVFPENNKIV